MRTTWFILGAAMIYCLLGVFGLAQVADALWVE
jgi:hypothetical protein